ncbi:MAG: PilC/PilY family type IV pilus protein [Polaromonas sp.]|nr:PilC/PilY family type IV pilus protein [Polaromonas sp.]
MKIPTLRIWLLAPLAVLLTNLPAAAADIDIYSGVAGGTEPNVLFFIDNTANWNANDQAWDVGEVTAKCNLLQDPAKSTCIGYVTQIFGSNTKLTQGRVELRALRLVLNELVCKTGAKIKVNAGIMLLNDAGSVDSSSVVSGYIRHRITRLDSNQCAVVLKDLDDVDSKISAFTGPASAEYGTALYEAFKYFGGWTNPAGSLTATAGSPTGATGFGPIRYSTSIDQEDPAAFTNSSKTTYLSPIGGTAVCGKNYIVLIGNKFPNDEYGTDTNVSPNPTNKLMARLNYNPGPQIYPKPLASSDKTDVRFADEWAKFLYKTDVSDVIGAQNVSMFTIDVYNKTANVKQGALLKSMADQSGPSGYFPVGGDLYGLINAFIDILTQVAAVDSVFASASLPVSVNAQGTFLNQVFMGVFRPDDNAQQRWVGNLKQYQFALDGSTLFLADATGKSAVDAVNSGFIQHCAKSYWTKDSGSYWESIAGMNNASACDPLNNLQPYSDLPDGPLVERGGAGQRLRDVGYAARNIQTCSTPGCTALTDFTTTNMTSLSPTLVDWARGKNNGDGNIKASTGVVTYTDYGTTNTPPTTPPVTRPTMHGEVVHSRPLAVNYGVDKANDVVVFYGAGDGMLHAVNGNQAVTDGNELWSFIAPEHWSTLDRVRTNSPLISYPNVSTGLNPPPTPKTYFFDGTIGGYQERSSSSVSKLWIYPTMRRGGRSVYAFDVTRKPSASVQPKLLWRYSDANDSRMGESWSTPVAIRVKGMSSPLVVFGAGYDQCDDNEDSTKCDSVAKGKGIVVMDAEKGSSANYRFIGVATGELDSSAGRFVADIAAVDIDRDGYTDVLYAVDTRGNIWRINTSDPSTSYTGYSDVSKWPLNKIAQVSDWSIASEKRKFMSAPSVVVLGSQATVLVGTGDREKPSADSTAAKVNNRFYGIRDDVTKTIAADITVARGYGVVVDPADLPDLKNVTTLSTFDPKALLSFKGWFRNLSTTSVPYEQVITTPLTFAGVTYFNTYQAKASGTNMCANLGTGRAYQIDFQTGAKLTNLDLVTTFITQGIPPSPVGGLVEINGKTVPFLIGGPGPTPLSPKKVAPQVRADRKPVYRYQRIDK